MLRSKALVLTACLSSGCVVQTESLEGRTGPQGEKGPPGQTGATGETGVSPFAYVDATMTDIYYQQGHVGIGTSTPTALLHVFPSGSSDTAASSVALWGGEGNALGNSFTTPSLVDLRAYRMNGNIATPIDQAVVARISLAQESTSGSTSAGHISFYTNSSNADGPAQERMTIDREGRVGIGTVGPWAPLTVFNPTLAPSDQIIAAFRRNRMSGGTDGLEIYDDGANDGQGGISTVKLMSTGAGQCNLGMGPSGAELTIKYDGKVGVGTTAPKSTLDVNGVIRATAQSSGGEAVRAVNTLGAKIVTLGNHSSDYGMISVFEADGVGESVRLTSLPGDPMWIDNGGSVGIGTTTPQATLDVNGTARLSKHSSQPFPCDPAHDGTILLNAQTKMCVCNGSAWLKVRDDTSCWP